MHLTGIDLLDWMGLRRVHEGGVARHGAEYLQWGQKMPCYLPEVFDRMAHAELTELLDPDSTGLRRVMCTPRGIDRYQELTTKRASWVDPEQPSGGCSAPRPAAVSFPIAAGRGHTGGSGPVNGSRVLRWLWSPADAHSHVLGETSARSEIALTKWGQELPTIAHHLPS